MATLTDNTDGTLTVALTPIEQDTFAGLPSGQLEAYVTLWLTERSTHAFQQQFSKLSQQEQTEMRLKLRNAGKGVVVG
jgi:hypothetical protein